MVEQTQPTSLAPLVSDSVRCGEAELMKDPTSKRHQAERHERNREAVAKGYGVLRPPRPSQHSPSRINVFCV